MTPDAREIDPASAALAQSEIVRAAVESRDPRPALDVLVARLRTLLGARQCFVIRVGTDQRARIAAGSGLVTPLREIVPRHDRDGMAATAMTERRVVSSPDVLNDPAVDLSPPHRAFTEKEGYRAAIAIPLLADTRVLGVLMAGRDRPIAFSPEQVELARAFADFATLVLERAGLSSEADARTRLDEALIDVERELLGELSLDRLLPLIVERARRLVDAQGALYLAEPDRRWLRRAWTTWPRSVDGVPFGTGLIGTCAERRTGLIVPDYPSWPNAFPGAVALGMHHVMAQPLLSLGRLLGVIVMGRSDPQAPFEPRDLDLLQRFATHAALALKNATLYEEAEQRRRGAEAVARMARALSETPSLDLSGERIVESVGGLFGLPCTVRLIQADGGIVAIASTDVASGHVQAAGTGLSAQVIAEGKAAITSDLLSEPGLSLDDDLRQRLAGRGALIVPLRAQRRITGVLQIVAPAARVFTDLEVELAQAVADQAAPALESARLHADLRTSEERTRLIIDGALDAVISIDVGGRVTGWNGQAERTFGWTRDEVMGRVLSETIIPPRYRAAHEEGLRRYRESGHGRVMNRRLELSALSKDGSEFPVELSISPVSTGEITTFTAVVRDIRDRAAAELAIRRQTSLVRLLQVVAVAANQAPTARAALQIGVDEVCAYALWPVGDAWVLADDGSGDLVPARIWHADPPERYRAFQETTHAMRLARGVGLPGRVLAARRAAWIIDIGEDANFPRAGAAREVGLQCAFAFPVLAGAEVVAVLEFFTGEASEPDPALLDAMANIGTQLGRVFERERAEADLTLAKDAAEAASRAKSSFLANMSHELRTPLNAILGYAQVLGRAADLGPEPRRAAGVIERSGQHLLSLITEVLDLAKIESGTIEMQRAPFDFPGLLASVADLMRARADDKGLAFTCESPAVLPAVVLADDKRLRQVLTNLLDNAIKYTARGRVALTVTRDGARYRFAVEDTGVGIAAEELPRIFETFHQVPRAHEFVEGTGLGLAISRTLVGLMGGSLDAESAPGVGSRFWFEIELPEAAAPDGAGVRRRVVRVRGDRRRLLVIDDNADNRQLLRDLLVPFGFDVDAAADAESGLARAVSTSPDAVLVDLRMPGMSGLEATQRLRTLDVGARLVVIAISASVFGHHRDECIAAGADDFLSKPFELDQLLERLCQHLGLEAIYDTEPGPGTAVVDRASAEPGQLLFPPRERLEALAEQARRGDIKQVLDLAARLEIEDGRYAPFVAELRGLARRFQVNRLCEFLQDGPSRS